MTNICRPSGLRPVWLLRQKPGSGRHSVRRIGTVSEISVNSIPVCCGEERTEPKDNDLCLPVDLIWTLTYGHELWVLTKRLLKQAAKINFQSRSAGFSLKDWMRSWRVPWNITCNLAAHTFGALLPCALSTSGFLQLFQAKETKS